MKKKTGQIVCTCRKCGCNLELDFTRETTAEEIVARLAKIPNMDCPNCGEEPYENWYLTSVDAAE